MQHQTFILYIIEIYKTFFLHNKNLAIIHCKVTNYVVKQSFIQVVYIFFSWRWRSLLDDDGCLLRLIPRRRIRMLLQILESNNNAHDKVSKQHRSTTSSIMPSLHLRSSKTLIVIASSQNGILLNNHNISRKIILSR